MFPALVVNRNHHIPEIVAKPTTDIDDEGEARMLIHDGNSSIPPLPPNRLNNVIPKLPVDPETLQVWFMVNSPREAKG